MCRWVWVGVVLGKLAFARGFRTSRMLVLLAPALLGACTTVQQLGPHGSPQPELWPQPVRSVGLAVHAASLVLGLPSLDAGPPAATAADATQSIRTSCNGSRAGVTWLGHSSTIINLGGLCILTDPVLTSDGPQGFLPKRLTAWVAGVDDLPGIDAIIFSHGDYDHLHAPTIRALSVRFPKALVLAPSGVAARIAAWGYPEAREMREGEAVTLAGVRMLALPAYHDTRRNLAGLRSGGALSWEVTHGRRKIMFIGDTAYGAAYSAIGNARGPYDIVLVPIGAYEPRHLVSNMHVNPEEAVQIARDLHAKLAIGIHWGTFALSPDRPLDAVRRFLAAGVRANVATELLRLGETAVLR